MEEEFCTFRDTVRAAIRSDCSTDGANPDLVVKDWSYRRSLGRDGRDRIDGIGIIYCTSAVQQLKVMDFIDSIGLGIHIIETPGGPPDGMKMSFRKPQFGPQDIAAILTEIFKCNGLKGPERCGSMEERTDTLRSSSPFRVCTVHFPEVLVQYARERSFRVDGPDDTITFYGKDVSRRVRAAAKAAKDKGKANAPSGPCPTCRDQPFDALTVGAALQAAYEAGRTATIPSIAGNDGVLVVPYPTKLVRLAWVAPRTRVSPPDVTSKEAFPSMSKAQKQRWREEEKSAAE
jgi:hypothetical protein